MKALLLGLLAMTLTGCITDREFAVLESSYYTRADIDAINAAAQCKTLARNLLQAARCDVRR
jgi:hypothetical protein